MRWPLRPWIVGIIVVGFVVAGYLMLPQITAANATINHPPPEFPGPQAATEEDCLDCHQRELEVHQELVSGSGTCPSCHEDVLDIIDQETGEHVASLRLDDGTLLPMQGSNTLCDQCHEEYYDAWEKRSPVIPGTTDIAKCVACHDPHLSEVALPEIIEPHPGVTPTPTPTPTSTLTPPPTTPPPPPELECIRCHVGMLMEFHDTLGSGDEGCWACHDNTYEDVDVDVGHTPALVLVDTTLLHALDSPPLCGQCHEERYSDWKEGIHGISAWKIGVPVTPGDEGTKCHDCHDSHQPQIALLDIIEPHPQPEPSPSPPPVVLLTLLGSSLLLLAALGVVMARRGKGE